jgi:hypothetical protein
VCAESASVWAVFGGQRISMSDSRVNLRQPWLAAFLAFLLPGLGHWYQGRRFKAAIFSAGILVLFGWGQVLGEGQATYSRLVLRTSVDSPQFSSQSPATKASYGFWAQVLVGLPAFPALLQEARFNTVDNSVGFLDAEIRSDFVGALIQTTRQGDLRTPVTGTLQVTPTRPEGSRTVQGEFAAVTVDGGTASYRLGGEIQLGRAVFGSPRRSIECRLVDEAGNFLSARIEGTISRSFFNWYMAPLDSQELDRLHGSLSRQYDIAAVLTWIAGLLNLMAIWDAAQGPAYGYGDESRREGDGSGSGGDGSGGGDGDGAGAPASV